MVTFSVCNYFPNLHSRMECYGFAVAAANESSLALAGFNLAAYELSSPNPLLMMVYESSIALMASRIEEARKQLAPERPRSWLDVLDKLTTFYPDSFQLQRFIHIDSGDSPEHIARCVALGMAKAKRICPIIQERLWNGQARQG